MTLTSKASPYDNWLHSSTYIFTEHQPGGDFVDTRCIARLGLAPASADGSNLTSHQLTHSNLLRQVLAGEWGSHMGTCGEKGHQPHLAFSETAPQRLCRPKPARAIQGPRWSPVCQAEEHFQEKELPEQTQEVSGHEDF